VNELEPLVIDMMTYGLQPAEMEKASPRELAEVLSIITPRSLTVLRPVSDGELQQAAPGHTWLVSV